MPFWYLSNLDNFRHLDETGRQRVNHLADDRGVGRKEVLYFQGAPDRNAYILKKGAIKLSKISSQGKELITDVLSAGSIFGELSAPNPDEKDESAIVIEEGVICRIGKEDFDELMRTIPGLATKISKVMGENRWRIENKLLDLLHRSVEQRLAGKILSRLDDFGVAHAEGYLLKVRLTHQDFADLIASARETVTSVLNHFKKQGVIEFEGHHVLVKNMEALKGTAGGL